MIKDIEGLKKEIKDNYSRLTSSSLQPERERVVNMKLDTLFGLIDQHDEREKPIVPQFVAEYFEKFKHDLEIGIYSLNRELILGEFEYDSEIHEWANHRENKPIETLVKMKLYGYEVEKEPLYRARLKVITDECIASYLRTQSLDAEDRLKALEIGSKYTHKDYRHLSEFTEDELKRLNIWDSEHWEVEEV